MLNRLLDALQAKFEHWQKMTAGATAIEYTLIVISIALAIVSVLTLIGGELTEKLGNVSASL